MLTTLPATVPAENGPDFIPVARETASQAVSRAAARLEEPFRPAPGELVSFLVNGLCLIGDHRVLEWEAGSDSPARALEALGHRVSAGGPGLWPSRPAGGFDRAFKVSRAFGYGGGESDRLWLKAMRRALQPGGLLLFPIFDRDRAWSLVERLSRSAGEGPSEPSPAAFAFDPRTGRVMARVRDRDGSGADPRCLRAAVRAFNLGEIAALLEENGFALERAYGDWQGGAPEEAGARTGRILVVASKQRKGRPRTQRRARNGSKARGAEKTDKEGGGT